MDLNTVGVGERKATAYPSCAASSLDTAVVQPESRQWSLHFSNSASGTMNPPTIGEFKGDRGEFYPGDDQRSRRARAIRDDERQAHRVRFEQAFSTDGGKTWEVNWLATDTRVPD